MPIIERAVAVVYNVLDLPLDLGTLETGLALNAYGEMYVESGYEDTDLEFTSAVSDLGSDYSSYTFAIDWFGWKLSGATVTVTGEVRAGNVATPDETWTSWSSIAVDDPPVASKRYQQIRLTINSDDTESFRLHRIHWKRFES